MYAIAYWFHDPNYVYEMQGTYLATSLEDLFAFTDMVKHCGGRCWCSLKGVSPL